MRIEPYIFFEGCAEQAAHFYQATLGAEIIALLRYSEAPDPTMCPVDDPEKVMHMNLRIGDSVVMGSDGNCSGEARFQGFALTLNAKDVNEAEKLFGLLADGGQVQMPLEETFFSPAFGMLADRFGVPWMIHVES
jgi:PhnB protein